MVRNGMLIGMILILSLATGGCGGAAEREQKREHDRTMMRLSDAERQRDELRAQNDALRKENDSLRQQLNAARPKQ
jgi:hypothetical protein